MAKAIRQEEILRFLQTKQYVSVQELCRAVYASPATVRRDLKALEAENRVRLFHGGATLAGPDEKEVPLAIRESENTKKKLAIAQRAVELLPHGASVLLDSSSTALYAAHCLNPEQNLTVFTNCLRTAVLLCERKISAYCIGGSVNRLSLSTSGSLAEADVRLVQADYLFFSSQGLDLDGTITDYSEADTALRRLMIRHAGKRYFLCDSDKVGKRMLFTVGQASEMDGVISDADLSAIPHIHWLPARK